MSPEQKERSYPPDIDEAETVMLAIEAGDVNESPTAWLEERIHFNEPT